MKSTLVLAIVIGAEIVAAVPIWGQCDGIGYTGSKVCDAGLVCVYTNDWYSQCQAGTAVTTTSKPPVTSSSTSSSSGPTTTAAPGGIKYMFVFGDSYTDTGFNIAGTKPAVGNQLGNPTYPGATSASGPNWIGLLTTKYSNSQILTYNFAKNGAVTTNSLCTPYSPTVPDISQQVTNLFGGNVASKPSYAPWTSANALFVNAVGVNDVLCSSGKGSTSQIAAYNTQIMNSYWTSMEKLYSYGARKFLFLGVSAVELSPMKVSGGASSQATQKATDIDYNNQIQSRITQFKASHPDVTAYYLDASTVFQQVASSPGSYGISNVNGYCSAYASSNDPNANSGSCPYPVKGYFWKDNLHPTWVVHEQLAKAIGAFVPW